MTYTGWPPNTPIAEHSTSVRSYLSHLLKIKNRKLGFLINEMLKLTICLPLFVTFFPLHLGNTRQTKSRLPLHKTHLIRFCIPCAFCLGSRIIGEDDNCTGDPEDLTGDCLICIVSGLVGELRSWSWSISLELPELEIPELMIDFG